MFGKTNWVLRGVRGAHAHAIYVLDVSVILGRSASADIQILDQRVSRQHARVLVTPDEVVLEDLGSHNGTYVHGHQVHRRPLRTGDRIQIGVSEYVFDQIKGRVLTSAVFLNKLTTRDTMGATAVKKRVAKEILTSPTAEMPMQGEETPELTAHVVEEETPGAPAPEPTPEAPEAEPAYLREQRERAVRLPTPLPGELQWSLHASGDEDTEPEPEPRPEVAPEPTPAAAAEPLLGPGVAAQTVPLDPRSQRIPTPVPQSELQTVPLDPRTQRVHTPVPESSQSPEPVPPPPEPEAEEDPAQEAALRTIDAVVRLLKLRAQESDGALLKIQDRENLRRLEGALRESRRNRANRRRWTRLPCQLSAQVGEDGDAQVTDIGAGGLRIHGGQLKPEPGDVITIRVHLGEGRLARIAVFQTKVAWVDADAGAFGAVFDGPAHWELAS